MNWNLEDLKRKQMIIKKKLVMEKNQEKIEYFIYELNALDAMINYISNQKNKDLIYRDNRTLSEEIKKAKIEFLEENLSFLTLSLDFLVYSSRLPYYLTPNRKIEAHEFVTLFENFLSEFEFDLDKTYREIAKDKAVNLSNRCFYDKSCLGVTYYLPTFASSYVDAFFNKRISSINSLPHEIAHAYQFEKTAYEQSKIMSYSVLNEAFPHFVELAFFDYLKNTKYCKNAINMEREFLDGVYMFYDVYGPKYVEAKGLKFVNDNYLVTAKNQTFSCPMASRFISKLLAYYFIYIYRNDKNGVETIKNFNECFRENREYEFFNNISNEKIIDSLKAEFKNYYDDIKHQKTFKLNRKL